METIPAFVNNPKLGNRILFKSNYVYLEYEDAKTLSVSEKVTLMKWGNVQIKSIENNPDGSFKFTGEFLFNDKDFKSTKKINWLPVNCPLTEVALVEYDHLLEVPKIEKDKDFKNFVKPITKYITEAWADPNIKRL